MISRISTMSKLPTFLTICMFSWYIGFVSCQHQQWHLEVSLFEDGEHQHPATSSRAKEAYFSEIFNALSRRLLLLGYGRFHFIRHGYFTLSSPQSKALFSSTQKQSTINDVFRNWKSVIESQLSGRTHGKDVNIILTRRPLRDTYGNEASGFATKGSICTKNNVVLVRDDGVYSAANKLVKVILNVLGVDVDGVGAASACSAHDGYLMGKGKLKVPLSFSPCTKRLLPIALRNLNCLKSRIMHKVGKDIPMPAKIKRSAYCSTFASTNCDDEGAGSLAHKQPKRYECLVYCCKGLTSMNVNVAPDGLECGDNSFKAYDKRCVNGACMQIR
ncbi:uncharacterized protein LOC142589082 [Dermacentor variabilis]|uniref:uncharacterized protein LOC142589082 n=1 Tax=Dermacentor variabilis TaxID=34621 RepID=UPI003F5B9426